MLTRDKMAGQAVGVNPGPSDSILRLAHIPPLHPPVLKELRHSVNQVSGKSKTFFMFPQRWLEIVNADHQPLPRSHKTDKHQNHHGRQQRDVLSCKLWGIKGADLNTRKRTMCGVSTAALAPIGGERTGECVSITNAMYSLVVYRIGTRPCHSKLLTARERGSTPRWVYRFLLLKLDHF